MTRTTLTALAFLFCTAFGLAATPSRQDVLGAIGVLEKGGAGPDAVAAAKTVVIYAQVSDDVMVDIGQEQLPWLSEKWNLSREDDQTCQSLLMAAFVAGNVKSQLRTQKAEDDTYAGWVFTLDAYRRLRTKFGFRSPAIEELSRMQDEGKLLQHARDVHASAEHGDAGDNPSKPLA